MKLVYRIFLFFLLGSQILPAGGQLTSGFEFLRTEFNPRISAMSGAYLTIRGDGNGMFINPAGNAYTTQRQFFFNYSNYLLDINGGSAGYVHPLPRWGRLTAGVQYMDYGSFIQTDESAEPTGQTFTAQDFAVSVGLADTLGQGFSYGVNTKLIFSKYEQYTAAAYALDFGLLYAAPFEKDLMFAATLTNVGYNFNYYASRKETLPLSLRLGISKKLEHLPLEISLVLNDLNLSTDNVWDHFRRFAIGGEFRMSSRLRLRMGYDNDIHRGQSGITNQKFAGVSAGIGIYTKRFRFDYAYTNMSALGNIHRFGISGYLK